ncbi:MAG: glycosyltransferase, partial [Candidatus Omnitrophica bacterium]|nr:glycosyltransferase [Candidatus Omnitrophota bacterium]
MIEQEKIALRLLQWMKKGYAPPFKISIFPTDRCNLRCGMCWQRSIDQQRNNKKLKEYEISEKRLIEIVREGYKLGVKSWDFIGGGEPFVRTHTMVRLIKEIKKLGMELLIVTNGTFLNYLAKILVETQCDNLVVSLDAPFSELNDFLRPPQGTFKKVICGITVINKLKDKLKRKKPEIKINSTVTKYNYHTVFDMVKLAHQLRIQGITFEMLQENCCTQPDKFKLNYPEHYCFLIDEMNKAYDFAKQNGLITNLDSFIQKLKTALNKEDESMCQTIDNIDNGMDYYDLWNVKCYDPWYKMHIHVAGGVSPCCFILPTGDNVKDKSIFEIWNGDIFNNFRKNFLEGRLSDECKNCCLAHRNNTVSIKKFIQQYKHKSVQRLHICFVSREYPPETGWGGIGTYTYQLAHGLVNQGHNVHVITQSLDVEKDYIDDGVFVHRISHKTIFPFKARFREFGLRWEYSLSVYRKLIEIIDKYNIDIVEAPNLSGEGFIYSFHKRTPLVTRLHTHYSEVINFLNWDRTLDRRLSCWFENIAILRSDLITCSTRAHLELVAREVGIRAEKIKIIPLGVPLPKININYKENTTPIVLFVGRLEKRKGIHTLIQSVPYILKEIPKAQFIIIGRDTFVSDKEVSFWGEKEYSYKEYLINILPWEYRENVKFLGY